MVKTTGVLTKGVVAWIQRVASSSHTTGTKLDHHRLEAHVSGRHINKFYASQNIRATVLSPELLRKSKERGELRGRCELQPSDWGVTPGEGGCFCGQLWLPK